MKGCRASTPESRLSDNSVADKFWRSAITSIFYTQARSSSARHTCPEKRADIPVCGKKSRRENEKLTENYRLTEAQATDRKAQSDGGASN